MSDIRTLIDDVTAGDWSLSGIDLASDDTIETAVILSLFTDARADPADALPAGETDRRGWWGDAVPEVEGDCWGSRLWLLAREKQTQETLARAREYAREALSWLLEDGHATRIDVHASWVRQGLLGLSVEVDLASGSQFRKAFEARLGGL